MSPTEPEQAPDEPEEAEEEARSLEADLKRIGGSTTWDKSKHLRGKEG